ncbi:MAG: PIN domain-containing protein [Planctomycetota bacterium]|nr:PIN domain-containing protein [Planctomycetota bacterium]
MTPTFADSAYYFALLNPDDRLHTATLRLSRGRRGPIVVTGFVLMELGDGLSRMNLRRGFIMLLASLRADPQVQIVPVSERLFERGMALYADRPDKEWSLTDCTSFVVMREHGLTEALTSDRHFEQAGFRALLATGRSD